MENAQGLLGAAAFVAIEQLRAIAGIAASILLGVSVSRSFSLPLIGGLAFGGGWGLVLLYAVQVRGIARGDGSASWSNVILASVAYVLFATYLLFDVDHILVVLDLSTVPFGIIYVAAKLGCHRIGCCNWKRSNCTHLLSLPLLEASFTAFILILAMVVSGILHIAGIRFCLFATPHVASWLIAKRFREDK